MRAQAPVPGLGRLDRETREGESADNDAVQYVADQKAREFTARGFSFFQPPVRGGFKGLCHEGSPSDRVACP